MNEELKSQINTVSEKTKQEIEKVNKMKSQIEEEWEKRRNREIANQAVGYGLIDIDFQELLEDTRLSPRGSKPFGNSSGLRTYVCVRKRILFEKEAKEG